MIAQLLVRYLRKDFQWLITSSDEHPTLDATALKKFIGNGFDPELGWARRPNTTGTESVRSAGALPADHKKVSFRINHLGGRENPGHEELPMVVSTYGDSFTFCRHVQDSETWQWYLSDLTQTNVLNLGVGNYGLDQGLLRLKREYNNARTKVVIMGVVPETIVRILGVWRHYYEYGNTFAFKPRFVVEGDGLSLIPNLIDGEDKFHALTRYLPEIQRADYFYRNRFKRHIIKFPYMLSILRRSRRNVPLISTLMLRKVYQLVGKRYDRPWELILQYNNRETINLYRDEAAVELMLGIVREFARFAETERFTPLFLLMPYQTDLEYLERTGTCYYREFVAQVSKIVPTVDLTEKLLSVHEDVYTSDFYGGHLNALGNKLVAQELFSVLFDENGALKFGDQVRPRSGSPV